MSGRVVVGVDGSETAKLAVAWAAREAALRGMTLELVAAWEVPPSAYAYGYGFPGVPEDLTTGMKERAERRLAEALDDARAIAPGIPIETLASEGQPADVLLHVAAEADLLVLGSRGLGGFRGLLLGSVSQQCSHHASCPVVIVRHLEEAA
jgi:nucleotide-binding universal stress UspA family protein